MKTITYRLKIKDEEQIQKWYLSLLKLLYKISNEFQKVSISKMDLVFYPINIDTLIQNKYFVISSSKEADRYLSKLESSINQLLGVYKIEYKISVKQKKE